MIDTHFHADTRPYEDFEAMRIAGVTDIVTLAHDPMKMSTADVFADHFDRLFAEKDRVGKNGIKLHVCLGIHPRLRPRDVGACFDMLEKYLAEKKGSIIAIGEAGLETRDPFEVDVLQRQIEIAMTYDLPIIIHTPRSGKVMMTKEAINVLSTYSIKKDRVVIDHADADTVKLILNRGYNAGLTVQPSKLAPRQAVEIIEKYDAGMLLLNTDASSSPTDVLGVPRTVHLLRLNGIDEGIVANVSEVNARRVFGIR